MASEKLTRTTYSDPTSINNPPRTGAVLREEALVDAEDYDRPLERIHGSTLHGWGIANGLSVNATLNASGLQVLPGVALDSLGRHISLAVGGFAEIGPNTDSPGTPPKLATVSDTGVTLPTTGLSGSKYLTIEFRETFDSKANTASGVFQYNHTPWLRLFDTAGFINKGTRLVLAQVDLDTGANVGKVLTLSAGVRDSAGLSTGSLNVRGVSSSAPTLEISDVTAGEIRPRAAGGLLLSTTTLGVQSPGGKEKITLDATSGDIALGGVVVNGNAAVSGKLTADTANFTHDATVVGNATVGANVTAAGNASISGSATVAGKLTADTANFTHDVTVSGNATIEGTLTNTGNATIVGNATISGRLYAIGVELKGLSIQNGDDVIGLNYGGIAMTQNLWVGGKAVIEHDGKFGGDLWTQGRLFKASGAFKIDHPLDPANKYLSHSFVESPDMMNVYSGNITTDDEGEGVVVLPDYFDALNRDICYQLTAIGEFSQAIVARKVEGNRFTIRTDRPRVEVSWQVTGVRRDAYAEQHRIVVEQDKTPEERGYYLHPEVHGQSSESNIAILHRSKHDRSGTTSVESKDN